jgi:glutamine amidotransferase
MCELFAVSSARAARVRLRFAEFATHGAPREPNGVAGNPDGWGAAYFDGVDAHVLREPVPAVRSAFARVLEDHDFHSPLVLAHVRRASRGPVALANTQPFVRELGGRVHVFAHNGDLPDVQARWPLPAPGARIPAQPVGQTDSEHAFCQLLRMLEPLWLDAGGLPDARARLDTVREFAERMRALGPANFLYSDGDCLFAHADRRHQADGSVREPGLHLWLRDASPSHQHEVEGLQVHASHPHAHRMGMFASVPLGQGDWQALPRGTVIGLRQGERVA